jgi:tetratricopeptide (TPR) repeat protein
MAALTARDPAPAAAAFARAATVAPDDARVTAGAARAAKLPQVNDLLRVARNHELAGEWQPAREALRSVERLDPETTGLAEALARVDAAAGRSQLQTVISTGFAHLDAGRHDAARTAFEAALRLDPNNASARGGLEQVAREAELTQLERLQQRADRALAEERWTDAETLYEEALALDPNIQFALAGRIAARARQQSTSALAAIIDDPDQLSSARAYEAARATLTEAEALDPRGPGLDARIGQVRAILETYATPVPVTLRSDNLTRVTVSSVGVLGAFAEKRLELRPGAYTVVGSRDGCRDVRARIVVRPDMGPVDIRCTESL